MAGALRHGRRCRRRAVARRRPEPKQEPEKHLSKRQSVGALGKQMLGTGQAGRLLQVGQQLPAGFNGFTSLSALPAPVRGLLPRGFNYVQQAGSIAVVDPASRIVRQVIPIPH